MEVIVCNDNNDNMSSTKTATGQHKQGRQVKTIKVHNYKKFGDVVFLAALAALYLPFVFIFGTATLEF